MIEQRPARFLGASRTRNFEALHHLPWPMDVNKGLLGWGRLRAINHAVMPPGGESDAEPIDTTDIVTLVRRGALEGTGSGPAHRIIEGEVGVLCLATGDRLGRLNRSNRPAEYVEIRLAVESGALTGCAQFRRAAYPSSEQRDRWALLASGFAEDRLAPPLRAGARVLGARVSARRSLAHKLPREHHAYAVAIAGRIAVNGLVLEAGDGAAITGEPSITIEAFTAAEIILAETL